MELDWSAQSPHIRPLFRPWQPGDGYDEATIQEAEARLGIRLPTTLRNFYQAWGKREDMTAIQNPLLPPDHLLLRGDVLEFWMENQAVSCGAFIASGWRRRILRL
jgi:cell wall assembly regulator SMI1